MKTFPLPQFIQLYPTFRCNQNCSFCFNHKSTEESEISHRDALRLLSILDNHSIKELDIMGGEPFLIPWMPALLREAAHRNITVNISTNGSLPGVVEQFRGLTGENINIGVSLEGSSPEIHNRLTGSTYFDKAVESIRRLVSAGLNPIVKTVLSRDTMSDITEIIGLLSDLGVRRYYLIHMDMLSDAVSSQRSAVSYEEFVSFYNAIRSDSVSVEVNRVNASCFEQKTLPEGVRCAGGVRKLAVMPDGSAYPCNLFQHLPDFMLGNIFSDSLDRIWQNNQLSLFRNFKGNNCSMISCSNHGSCTGGCPAHAFCHGYSPDGQDIRCRQ